MIARALFDQVLGRLTAGGVIVHYWDGKTKSYGPGKPNFEITIKHPRVLRAMLRNLSLGFGEAYMDGSLEIKGDILKVSQLAAENQSVFKPLTKFPMLKPRQRNRPGRQRSQIAHHYDLGNDFYKLWLDESMTYSCAYFRHDSDSLELAQNQKVDHILRKLQLNKGQSLLDIGCGWGALICWAAEHYGVNAHGITLSQKQYDHTLNLIKQRGLEQKVSVELMDYRDLQGEARYDKLVSVGMFEHVGLKNLPAYFAIAHRLLKPGGLFLNHGITSDEGGWKKSLTTEFINRYVFPDGQVETIGTVQRIMEDTGFEIHDVESLRQHYALTLREWVRRLEEQREEALKYVTEPVFRIWRLYMAVSALQFEEGCSGIYQVLISKRTPFARPVPLTRNDLYQPSH